jgi:hypothetical protein
MTYRGVAIAAMLAAGIGGCSGCDNRTQTVDNTGGTPRMVETTPELIAQASPPIADVPLPVKFKLDEGKSWSRVAGGVRWIDHTYYGPADKFVTWRFFKKHMPGHQWTLMRDEYSEKTVRMDFEKANERCQVTIGNGTLFNPSRVRVYVYSAGATPTGR